MEGYDSVRQKRQNKTSRKQMVQSFIENEEVAEKLRRIALSQLAVYKAPGHDLFSNLANILTVALRERWGSENVYQKYREWKASGYDIPEIAEYLETAMKNIGDLQSDPQSLITDYYSADIENNDKMEGEGEGEGEK